MRIIAFGYSTRCIASFAGMKAREIVTYRKCELCKRLFDSPETLERLSQAAGSELPRWSR